MNLARSMAATVLVLASILSAGSAGASESAQVEWSTEYTHTESVTITETAEFEGYTGTGTATASATATATGTAQGATWWEVNYYASVDAYTKAKDAATAEAEAEARGVARQRAEDDARAKAAAGPVMIEWSTEYTQTESVTVTETAEFEGYTGTGTATATATATATGSATAATWWEVNYYATMDAYTKARLSAREKADAEARPIAKQRALDDAKAKAEAGPVLIEWTTEYTATETVTVTESVTIDGFEGYGTATATATATASGTAREATNWEVYYWASTRAYTAATQDAKAKADAEARALATELARADAQAQADAAAAEPDPEPDPTDPEPDPTDPEPDPTDPTDPAEPAGPSCGATVLKADGSPWTCTLVDNFRGDKLDTQLWTAVETSTSSFAGDDCFVGLGDNVRVQDGTLGLVTQREDEPFTCMDPAGSFETSYTSASLTSLGKFSQTYGRFEIRAAMPASDGPGLHSALWLIPDVPYYYGAWPHSGEIDIVEYYSANPDRLVPALHYNSADPFTERTNNTCLVFDPTTFHTYTLEWTTQKLKIMIDGETCLEHTINPLAPLQGSAPFDRPFNINLTQALGQAGNSLPEGATIDEATMQVDYVRVWS